MSTNNPGTFKAESRPYGDDGKLVPMLGCTCSKCDTTQWKRANSPGAGHAIFRKEGWSLGRNGSSTDVCPSCVKKQSRKLKKPKVTQHLHLPHIPRDGNTVMKDKLLDAMQAKVQMDPTPVATLEEVLATVDDVDVVITPAETTTTVIEEPPRLRFARGRYATAQGGVDFAKKWNAARSATSTLFTVLGRKAAENADYKLIEQPDGRWSWTALTPPPETKEPEPMSAAIAPPAPGRQPTREDRQKIAALLDIQYNTDTEKWKGDWSDAKGAAHLDVPRQWVTDLRVALYGEHDRNESVSLAVEQLNAWIDDGQKQVDRLLSMATEAEQIVSALRSRRDRLIGKG